MTSLDQKSFEIQERGDVSSIHAFISSVFDARAAISNRKLWYRGHSKVKYELIPTIGRKLEYMGKKVRVTPSEEVQLLHRFRRRAYPLVGRAMTAGEAIFLARHHGLPTRVLDWTANALFALCFACVENQDCDGTVWAMLRRPESEDFDAFRLAALKDERELFSFRANGAADPSDKYALKILHPFYNSPRLVAQDGAFTWHSDPWNSIESYAGRSFSHKNLDIERLYRWRVPATYKVTVIKDLSGLGITRRTVFPDLDGIAGSLWETQVLWWKDPPPYRDREEPRSSPLPHHLSITHKCR